MKALITLSLLFTLPSLSYADINLMNLGKGSEFKVNKPISLKNNMFEHQARGHYLDEKTSFERRWEKDRRSVDHCSLELVGSSAKSAGVKERLELPEGAILTATGNAAVGGYEQKRMVTTYSIDDFTYRERKTGLFLMSFTVDVAMKKDGISFPGVLSCEFSLDGNPRGFLSSEHLSIGTKRSVQVLKK